MDVIPYPLEEGVWLDVNALERPFAFETSSAFVASVLCGRARRTAQKQLLCSNAGAYKSSDRQTRFGSTIGREAAAARQSD